LPDFQSLLRELPAVDRLLREPLLEELQQRLPRRIVLQAAQDTIALYRKKITAFSEEGDRRQIIDLSPALLAQEAAALAEKSAALNLKPLINATGVIIHTNLGRAPLAQSAADALMAVARNYSNLELSLDSGRRGSRQEHIEDLLCELSGSEAAVVVNNNAAAVFLALNTVAFGREVIVSRGQLVEIGGSFRIPEIMAASGARLVEIGTTNKTYLRDYEAVVTENSAAFLKVHTSNYQMVGFTAEVSTPDLAGLAHKNNLLLIEDLGSGVFLDLEKYNLPPEPRVQDSIAAGADLVTFSGDKMLGGPQAGIIVGRKDLISYIRSNQLARTLRIDKFTLAALESTLRLFLDEETAIREIPVLRMLTASSESLHSRAKNLATRFAEIFGAEKIDVIPGISRVGGGALPMAELSTYLVAVRLTAEDGSPELFVEKLRHGNPPVILRLQQDSLLFDPRTIFEDQEDVLIERVLFCAKDS
jgi:L-seryl-tRNA(Ser) seleniumtransferase